MKNLTKNVDGETVAFDEDGRMKHTILNITNMDRNRKWVKVSDSYPVIDNKSKRPTAVMSNNH